MSAYTVVLASVTAETGLTQKVPVLVAGIKSAMRTQFAGRQDEDMKPNAVKAVAAGLDEIAASNAALLTALLA